MRAFIAIELPTEIKTVLGNIQVGLKQAGADVKWVKPENIHLTLKFLGEIDESLVEKTHLILAEIARRNQPFELSLSELGAFPRLNSPRVIWVGVSGDEPVVKIAEDIERETARIGLPAESRPFSSHITLGRTRSPLNRAALVERINSLNRNLPSPRPRFMVRGMTLFKSTLTPSGPIYETLRTVSF